MTDQNTREVAESWFRALAAGDLSTITDLLAEDVEFINNTPVPGYNDDMPWIGTYRGRKAALDSLGVFVDTCEVLSEEVVRLLADGDMAMGVIHEVSRVRSTGLEFEIEFIQSLTIRNGRISRWQSFTDPSTIIRAIRGDAAA
jgi:ketosteroid isomerase-like protein